jgi:hypothetical protein
MSHVRSATVDYRCLNDCQQTGCPGHTLVFERDLSSDIYRVHIDGEHTSTYVFDENMFRAMLLAYTQSHNR